MSRKTDSKKDYEESTFGTTGGKIVSTMELQTLARLTEPQPNETLLEIGTGTGRIAREMIESDAYVIGVDINKEQINHAVKKNTNVDKLILILTDAQHLPFKDESVDTVYCMRVLKWIPDPIVAIFEMTRVLKPGGKLILDVSNIFGWEIITRIPNLIRTGNLGYPTLFRISKVEELLKQKNFEIVASVPFHKIPLMLYDCFESHIVIRFLLVIDNILKKITPKKFLSRSILLKCVKICQARPK